MCRASNRAAPFSGQDGPGSREGKQMKGWRALLQCGEHFLYKHENLSLDPTTHTELNVGACVWYPSALYYGEMGKPETGGIP